jgi:hypothetical protein
MRIHMSLAFTALMSALLSSCNADPAAIIEKADAAAPSTSQAATAQNPVVVEIFQSQGCSSCPPANANINAIADKPNILALSFSVTYWDNLGWKDRFAQPAFTDRQWDYARHAKRDNVYTPQVIVNGSKAIVGNVRSELDRAISAAGRPTGGPAISVDGSKIAIGPDASGSTVWFVRYDPKSRNVPIRAGENNGRTLPHRHIVTALIKLGVTGKAETRFAIPASGAAGLSSAILVQRPSGGAIVAARRL